jgi:hypothetical protein
MAVRNGCTSFHQKRNLMTSRFKQTALWAFIICIALSGNVFAQKKPLMLDDYAQWQSLGATLFSPDGNWFAYSISQVEGDGWLTVRKVGSEDEHKLMYGSRPSFSNDNRWFAFAIGVSEDEEKKLEDSKKPIRLKLGLMDLASAVVDTFEFVESFEFSDSGEYIAMKKYKAEGVKTKGTDLVIRDLAVCS